MITTIISYLTWSSASKLLGKLWRGLLDFIATPIGAAILAGFIMYSVGTIHERNKLNASWQAKWDAAEQQAEMDRIQRDLEIKKEVSADADQRLSALVKRKAELEQQVKDYESEEIRQSAADKTGGAKCSPLTNRSDELWLQNAKRGSISKGGSGHPIRLHPAAGR